MKQSIRELWGPGSLKDTGSRECYYFYISLHLSPILKQLDVFLLSLHLVSRGARLQLLSGARGSSLSETRGLRKGWVWESLVWWLCPGGGWQPWGNWTPTSDVWASGAPLNSLELCLCSLKDALQTRLILCILSQSGGWAVFLSGSPASHTCCLWDYSTFSPMFPIFLFLRVQEVRSEGGRKRSSL